MAMMSFQEIESLIESGRADDEIAKFIHFATSIYIGLRTGQMDDLPGMRETVVAAVVLQKLANTAEGRKLLGRKASNKVYNAADYPLGSKHLDIGRRFVDGVITHPEALAELRCLMAAADIHPDPKTLKNLLSDLAEQALNLRSDLEAMMRLAGWDGSEEGLKETLASIMCGNVRQH